MLRSLLRRFTTTGVRIALAQLLWELRSGWKHSRGRKALRRREVAPGSKLHMGSGANVKDGWLNLDMHEAADYYIDLRESMDFEDDTFSLIYSEHFLEHVDYPEPAMTLYRDCLRILQPGGRFSCAVPDTEWPLLEYAGTRDEDYFKIAKQRFHPASCRTRMEHINFHFRQGREHRYAYDFETMAQALEAAGFTDIRRREYEEGLDRPEREVGSLYVDAIKPVRS